MPTVRNVLESAGSIATGAVVDGWIMASNARDGVRRAGRRIRAARSSDADFFQSPRAPRTRSKDTFGERLLLSVAPDRYVQRKVAQQVGAIMASGGYRGSRKSRFEQDWIPADYSADQFLAEELADLRNRSRDLIRNNPVAKSIVNSLVQNVVGDGISPQPRLGLLGYAESRRQRLEQAITQEWQEYGEQIDASGQCDMGQLQALVFRQILENGEAILLRIRDKAAGDDDFVTRWRLIESDHLETPQDKASDSTIKNGVKVDANDRPVGYYLSREHPGDKIGLLKTQDFQYVPAVDPDTGIPNVLHLFPIERAGQHRGVPLLAPSITFLKSLDRYVDAELMGALVSACFAVFVKSNWPGRMAAARTKEMQGTDRLERVTPGMIEHLGPGEEIDTFEPKRNTSFASYTEFFMRMIGAGSNLGYEKTARDFSKTNYSSSRSSSMEDQKGFRLQQKMLVRGLVKPVYQVFIRELASKASTRVLFRGYFERPKLYCRASWIGPGYTHVDPVKETQASVERLNNHLSTLAAECSLLSLDWEEVLEQRAREFERMKTLGLPIPASKDAPGNTPQNPQEDDDE